MSLSAPVANLDDPVRRLLVLDSLRRTAFVGVMATLLGVGGGQLGYGTMDYWMVPAGAFVLLALGTFAGHYRSMARARAGHAVELFNPLTSLHDAARWAGGVIRPLMIGLGIAVGIVAALALLMWGGHFVFWPLWLAARFFRSQSRP